MVACSCNHHLGHFGNVLSRLDEVLEALFGSQTAHAQDVGTRCDAMFLQEVGGGAAAGGRNAVGDISGFGKHAVGEFLTLKFVDKNNVVAESECQRFAHFQQSACKESPLFVLVVWTMISEHHL